MNGLTKQIVINKVIEEVDEARGNAERGQLLNAVSYTHLDVYKRQLIGNDARYKNTDNTNDDFSDFHFFPPVNYSKIFLSGIFRPSKTSELKTSSRVYSVTVSFSKLWTVISLPLRLTIQYSLTPAI